MNNDKENEIKRENGQNESEIYGVSCTPGDNGYSYAPYRGFYQPTEEEKKKIRKKGRIALFITLILAAAMTLCAVSVLFGTYIAGFEHRNRYLPESGTEAPDTGDTTPPSSESSGGNAIIYKEPENIQYATSLTEIVAAVKPSVVEVITESVVNNGWFGNYIQSGAGSGVIIMKGEQSGEYYVVTNNHVIDGAQSITVRLTDGSEYVGELVGTDIFSDVALLKIDVESGKSLSVATVANSAKLVDGQDVFVIGNPLGTLGGSVSKGIVSCTERNIKIDGIKMTLLQIDAAVNPGNSGGALFDTSGNLVGIVNAKYSDETVEGLGFAIPINKAIEVIEAIYENGYVPGIATLELSLADQSYTSNSETITRPTLTSASLISAQAKDEDGNAVSFSFNTGDFIDSVNGTAVSGTNALLSLLSEYSVGDTVELVVYRPELTNSFWGRYEYVRYTVIVTLTEYVPTK